MIKTANAARIEPNTCKASSQAEALMPRSGRSMIATLRRCLSVICSPTGQMASRQNRKFWPAMDLIFSGVSQDRSSGLPAGLKPPILFSLHSAPLGADLRKSLSARLRAVPFMAGEPLQNSRIFGVVFSIAGIWDSALPEESSRHCSSALTSSTSSLISSRCASSSSAHLNGL